MLGLPVDVDGSFAISVVPVLHFSWPYSVWVVNGLKEMCLLFSAFDLALALTELDEVCELVTDARYAYGKTGKYVTTLHFL